MDKEKISRITLDDAIEAFNYRKNTYKKLILIYPDSGDISKVFDENFNQLLNFEGDLSEFLKQGSSFRSRCSAGNYWYNLFLSLEKGDSLNEKEILQECLKGEEATLQVFDELVNKDLPVHLQKNIADISKKISESIHKIKLLLSE